MNMYIYNYSFSTYLIGYVITSIKYKWSTAAQFWLPQTPNSASLKMARNLPCSKNFLVRTNLLPL